MSETCFSRFRQQSNGNGTSPACGGLAQPTRSTPVASANEEAPAEALEPPSTVSDASPRPLFFLATSFIDFHRFLLACRPRPPGPSGRTNPWHWNDADCCTGRGRSSALGPDSDDPDGLVETQAGPFFLLMLIYRVF